MSENINYTYESKPVDIAILSVLDVTSDGKIVSAADWTALWNTVLMRINHLDKYCSDISTLIIRWQESITAFDKAMSDINAMFNTLSNSFIHYGEEAPTDDNVRLWVQPNSEVDDKSLVTKAELTAAITNSEAAIDATTDQKLAKTIKMWQPNTEYKKGDRCLAIVPTDIPYFCEYKLINCAVDHTSSDSVEDDIEKVMWLLTFDGIGKSLSDAYGNVIHETYATKKELAEAIGQALEGDY